MTLTLQGTIFMIVVFVGHGSSFNDQETKNYILKRLDQQDHKIELQNEKILEQDKRIEELEKTILVHTKLQMHINDTIDKLDIQIENTNKKGKNLKAKVNTSFSNGKF